MNNKQLVYVENYDDDSMDNYKRMTYGRAIKEEFDIIQCSFCKNPAYKLDHLFPYHQNYNYCRDCWKNIR